MHQQILVVAGAQFALAPHRRRQVDHVVDEAFVRRELDILRTGFVRTRGLFEFYGQQRLFDRPDYRMPIRAVDFEGAIA